MTTLTLKVNGYAHTVNVDPATPLMYILRNDLELNGPRFGCGLGQCGACTVIAQGNAIRSCVTPVSAVQGIEIITLEGLGTLEKPHPIQKAFVAEQAAGCGYCMNGMMMTAKAFLDKNPMATEADIRHALDGTLCRCATHLRILRAVQRYAKEVRP
jgi:nicotinate dehydrogenase subunit A